MVKNWSEEKNLAITQTNEHWNKGVACILTSYIENLIR